MELMQYYFEVGCLYVLAYWWLIIGLMVGALTLAIFAIYKKTRRVWTVIPIIFAVLLVGCFMAAMGYRYNYEHRFSAESKQAGSTVDFAIYVPAKIPGGYDLVYSNIGMTRNNKPYYGASYRKPYQSQSGGSSGSLELTIDEHKVPAQFNPPSDCTSGIADLEGVDGNFPNPCNISFTTSGGNLVYERVDCGRDAFVRKGQTLIWIGHVFYDEVGDGCKSKEGRDKLSSFIDGMVDTPANKVESYNKIGT
jgi:energy-coupling factor transporter transmembrane protein EcfT